MCFLEVLCLLCPHYNPVDCLLEWLSAKCPSKMICISLQGSGLNIKLSLENYSSRQMDESSSNMGTKAHIWLPHMLLIPQSLCQQNGILFCGFLSGHTAGVSKLGSMVLQGIEIPQIIIKQ